MVALGDDKSRILAASSKKGRFALDTELKKFGFVQLEIPQDFKGIPDDVLLSLASQEAQAQEALRLIEEERHNMAETHEAILRTLLASFSLSSQIAATKNRLEATSLVYRITGWIPESDSHSMMTDLGKLTEDRVAIRVYQPLEVPSVLSGEEKEPVRLKHGWNKFAPIFMAIGCSSMIMGLLTGEFFATESVLEPFAHWITGLFGTPQAPILNLSPVSKNYIGAIFGIFGVTIGIGFVINSIGLVINMINNLSAKRFGKAFFGKTGLSGALFFWYVVIFAIRIAALHHSPLVVDWIVIALLVFFSAFGEPFERLVDGERPVLENGVGAMVIGGVVEIIELVSTYLSCSISFVRVGAFALAHAVLGFIINMMTETVGGVGGVLVLVAGNAIVVVLEGMIVAIQVIRLQYYEFFSKFFNETGREFKPFAFEYKALVR